LSGGARGALWTVLALALFFAADSLIFRAGWYGEYLEPDSSAGSLESHLYWLAYAPAPKVPQVLVVGDSRIAEGFSSRTATASTGRSLYFWNLGVGGTVPRIWYYALRDLDPTRRRYAAIVIGLDRYSDEDWDAEFEDRISDQNYLVMRLGFGDCVDFAGSMRTMANRHRALAGCLFRGMVLRSDVQAFLADPETRMRRADDWLINGLNYDSGYSGKTENLSGLSVDWSNRTIQFPDGVSDPVRAELNRFLLPEPVANTGALARYRQRWLGGILDLYKDSPTRLIFLRLPRAPLVRPDAFRPGATISKGFVVSAAHTPRVDVLPAETFTDLERPEWFADALHLNRQGRPVFSTRLAGLVDAILAGRATGTGGGR